MFELQTLYVYVCFESETSEHVCMSQAAERVCLYVLLILDSPKPLEYINIFDPSHLLILVRKSLQSMDNSLKMQLTRNATQPTPSIFSNVLVLDYKFIYQ